MHARLDFHRALLLPSRLMSTQCIKKWQVLLHSQKFYTKMFVQSCSYSSQALNKPRPRETILLVHMEQEKCNVLPISAQILNNYVDGTKNISAQNKK
jgi:hypothetical protein